MLSFLSSLEGDPPCGGFPLNEEMENKCKVADLESQISQLKKEKSELEQRVSELEESNETAPGNCFQDQLKYIISREV